MLDFFRSLFVRHSWVYLDDATQECSVCSARRTRDVEVEVIGSNPWTPAHGGDLTCHIRPAQKSRDRGTDRLSLFPAEVKAAVAQSDDCGGPVPR
jgi:hypothetical protein